MGIILQPHLTQRLPGFLLSFGGGNAGKRHAKRRVVEHAHVRHQCKGLKNHRNFFTTHLAQLGVRHFRDIDPVNQHLAAGGFNQAIEKANHGGFPRAGEPHDDEYLAFFNGQTGVFDAKRQPRFFQYLRFVESFLNIFESTVRVLAKYLIKIFNF